MTKKVISSLRKKNTELPHRVTPTLVTPLLPLFITFMSQIIKIQKSALTTTASTTTIGV